MLDLRTAGLPADSIAESIAGQWLLAMQRKGPNPLARIDGQEAVHIVRRVILELRLQRLGRTSIDAECLPSRALVSLIATQALRIGATPAQLSRFIFALQDALTAEGRKQAAHYVGAPAAAQRLLNELLARALDSLTPSITPEQTSEYSSTQELDRLLEEFVSLAGHELRTPLTSIKAYMQLALRRLDRMVTECPHESEPGVCGVPEFGEHLRVAIAQTDRLSRLVNELLETTQLRNGRFKLVTTAADLRSTVTRAVQVFRNVAPQVPVSVELPADALVAVGDHDRLEQVIQHLLSNAARFSPDGGTIEVGLRQTERPERSDGLEIIDPAGAVRAEVAVTDHGLGIAQEDLPFIFDRFSRVSNPAAARLAGLGLGLWVSKEIVAAHGGRVWVESALGSGSTFYFEIPLRI